MLLHYHLVRHDADKVVDDTDFIAVVEKRLISVLVELIDLLGRDIRKELILLVDGLGYRLYDHFTPLLLLRLIWRRVFVVS